MRVTNYKLCVQPNRAQTIKLEIPVSKLSGQICQVEDWTAAQDNYIFMTKGRFNLKATRRDNVGLHESMLDREKLHIWATTIMTDIYAWNNKLTFIKQVLIQLKLQTDVYGKCIDVFEKSFIKNNRQKSTGSSCMCVSWVTLSNVLLNSKQF